MVMAFDQDPTRYAVNNQPSIFGQPIPNTAIPPSQQQPQQNGEQKGSSDRSAPLQDRVDFYITHPGSYTDLTYKLDPQAYTAVPIYRAFQNTYGRAPTANEYAMYGNVQTSGGNVESEIAAAKAAEDNSPTNIAKREQEKQLAEAPKHYDAVNSLFQSTLGRAATQDELSHFGSLLSSGTTDQYQLSQWLQQQPEYQTTQNNKFTAGLSDKLAGYDKQYFSNSILPSIQEQFAKQGRSFDSSAFANSATQSAEQQNTQRQQYLAQLSAQQYGGVQDRAYNDYAAQVQNQNNLTNSGIQAQYAATQANLGRVQNINDYSMQQNAYNNYLAKYGKRSNGLGGLIGTVGGALLGGFLPGGSIAGAQLGSSLGGAVGGAAQNSMGGSY